MKHEGIGLWMYRNQGGDEIQKHLKERLLGHGIPVFNDFDLRHTYCENGRVFTESGFDLSSLAVLYHMNADEQSPYQIHVLEALENSGVHLVNSFRAFSAASDKFMANLLMRQAGVRVPQSALFASKTAKDIVRRAMAKWGSAVVKPRFSYGGKGILKFDNASMLMDFVDATRNFYIDFYIEEFIPFKERDYRVEILDEEYVGSYSRGLLHSFKTNMSAAEQSSDGLFLPNPADGNQITQAKMAARAVGLDATIVDMVRSIDDDHYYVLEVNCMLGIFVEAANALMGINPTDPHAYDHASDQVKLDHLTSFLVRRKDGYRNALHRNHHQRNHHSIA